MDRGNVSPNRPRTFGGVVSAMYTGPATFNKPDAKPVIKRPANSILTSYA